MINENQKILYWNCTSSFLNKLDIIMSKIVEHSPEIFFVSESNINNEMCQDLTYIKAYDFINSNIISEFRKSRICCYYTNTWRPNLEFMSCKDEVIILERGQFTVIGLYRSFKLYTAKPKVKIS